MIDFTSKMGDMPSISTKEAISAVAVAVACLASCRQTDDALHRLRVMFQSEQVRESKPGAYALMQFVDVLAGELRAIYEDETDNRE